MEPGRSPLSPGTFSNEQRRQLGEPVPRTPAEQALWDQDPDNVAWKKRELERVRREFMFTRDPDQVAAEARELRPDPEPR